MKLFINTQQSNLLEIQLGENKYTQQLNNPREADLLAFISQQLNHQVVKLEDITEVVVQTGPGPFTALRTGCAVAQAIAFSLGVPINGHAAGSTIQIEYGKPPNITIKKK